MAPEVLLDGWRDWIDAIDSLKKWQSVAEYGHQPPCFLHASVTSLDLLPFLPKQWESFWIWQMQEAKFRFRSRSWSSNHASGRTSYWDGFTPIRAEWKVMENRLGQGAETGKCPHTCNVKHIQARSYLHHDLGLKEIKKTKMCPSSIHGRLLVHSPWRCWPERSRWHSSGRLSQSNRQSNRCCRLSHFHLNAVPHCKCASEVMKQDEALLCYAIFTNTYT